jgi:siroheme synthase
VVSGHLPPGHPDSSVDWPGLARSAETLVLLMAVGNLDPIAACLLGNGQPPTTPVACIQHAATPATGSPAAPWPSSAPRRSPGSTTRR